MTYHTLAGYEKIFKHIGLELQIDTTSDTYVRVRAIDIETKKVVERGRVIICRKGEISLEAAIADLHRRVETRNIEPETKGGIS